MTAHLLIHRPRRFIDLRRARWPAAFAALMVLGQGAWAAAGLRAVYVCEDGTRLIAVFSKPGKKPATADLTYSGVGRQIVLEQAASADGGRYTGSGVEFWIKGRSATLTEKGAALSCRVKGG